MEVKLVDRGREGEVLLIGAMDALCQASLEQLLGELTRRFDRLILNMAGVDYVFSPGLRLLKQLHLEMQAKGGELILTHVEQPIVEVLELAGMTGLLHLTR